METPFALNSLPLRQRARWRIRSQVSWRKTCKPSALYNICIHAFFINLRNPIPLQIHESPPFTRHPVPKSVFVPPRLWQSKRKKPNFFCKERLWVYNYVMQKTKIIQKDYSLSLMNYQLKLPFELEVLIPDDDPVRLLSAFVEELELTDLYRSYGKIKKEQVTPTVTQTVN